MLVELPKDDSKGPDIPGKLKLLVTRQPYDDHYSILLPTGSEEYVPTDKAERILLMYGVKDPEKILTHVWNFYTALIYVNDPAANATAKPGSVPRAKLPEWGWKIQLRRKGTASSLTIHTPGHGRYSLEVDEEGNVVEYVSGNYTRVVEGAVMTFTGGSTIETTEGPLIMQSGEYTALNAEEVHFNPEEFKEGVPADLPEKLKS